MSNLIAKSLCVDVPKTCTSDLLLVKENESQLKKMDQEARKNGFKNKSEMLASFIDAL